MRGRPNPELKAECVRLRVEERLSLGQIHKRTGAPKGSLSSWLRDYPLSNGERKKLQSERSRRMNAMRKKPRGEESPFYAWVRGRNLSTMQKAKIAESAVLFRLALLDLPAFGSVFDGDKTDWLVEIPRTGRVLKVQVRWAQSWKHGLPTIKLTCSSGRGKSRRFKRGEFDVIVAYDLYTDTAYVWTWDELVKHKSTVTVSESAAEKWEKLSAL